MATQTVTQAEVEQAIQRLSNVQGSLMCAVKVLDDTLTGSPHWEVSEAIHGAIEALSASYCTLNDNNVTFTVEAQS